MNKQLISQVQNSNVILKYTTVYYFPSYSVISLVLYSCLDCEVYSGNIYLHAGQIFSPAPMFCLIIFTFYLSDMRSIRA